MFIELARNHFVRGLRNQPRFVPPAASSPDSQRSGFSSKSQTPGSTLAA